MNRKEQAHASRAGLVTAARQCFAADGYDATTVASILKVAGMARGALYHYFPDGKRDIFMAVFDQLNDEYHHQRDSLAAVESPLDRVTAAMGVFLACCMRPDFAQIVLADGPRLIPAQARPGSSFRMLKTQIDEAIAANEMEPIDSDAMAMILYGAAMNVGTFVLESADPTAALVVAGNTLKLLIAGLRTDHRRSR